MKAKKTARIGISLFLCALLALGAVGCGTKPTNNAYEPAHLQFGMSREEVMTTLSITPNELTASSKEICKAGFFEQQFAVNQQIEVYGHPASVLLTFYNEDYMTDPQLQDFLHPDFDYLDGLTEMAFRYPLDLDPAAILKKFAKETGIEADFPIPTGLHDQAYYKDHPDAASEVELTWESKQTLNNLQLETGMEELLASYKRSFPKESDFPEMFKIIPIQDGVTSFAQCEDPIPLVSVKYSSDPQGYLLTLQGIYAAGLKKAK